jgi:hypothetical protein
MKPSETVRKSRRAGRTGRVMADVGSVQFARPSCRAMPGLQRRAVGKRVGDASDPDRRSVPKALGIGGDGADPRCSNRPAI